MLTPLHRKTHPKTGQKSFTRGTPPSQMAEQDMLIGSQVAVDLDNGAALDGVVAAAQLAWGFNFVAPSIHHF